jgi:hypothetical protein
MSTHDVNQVLPFLPPALDRPKRKARQLWKAYRNRVTAGGKPFNLDKAQQVTARVMGYPDWHALAEAVKTQPHQTLYDRDLPPELRDIRQERQIQTFCALMDAAPGDARNFLSYWNPTGEFHQSPFLQDLIVPPDDVILPVTRQDLASGEFDKFARLAYERFAYRHKPFAEFYDNLCRAFGYAGAAGLLEHAQPEISSALVLPETDTPAIRLVCWRLYLLEAGSLCYGLSAVRAAWDATRLDIKERLSRRENRFGNGWHRYSSHDLRLYWADLSPKSQQGLRPDGMFWNADPRGEAIDCMATCWKPESGKMFEDLRADTMRDLWIPFDQILEEGGLRMPAGITRAAFRSREGELLGHGFKCKPAGAYLNAVYPPGSAAYFEALKCLWWKKPVPPGIRFDLLPELVYANDTDAEFVFRPFDSSRVQQDLVKISKTGLALGVSVGVLGNEWRRMARVYSRNDVPHLLGFVPSPDTADEALTRLGSLALDESSSEVVCSVYVASETYSEREDEWLQTDEGQLDYCNKIVQVWQALKTEIKSPGQHHDDEFGSEADVIRLCEQWPLLTALPETVLHALVAWFPSKMLRRRDMRTEPYAPTVLAFLLAVMLGLDADTADIHSFALATVGRLARLALGQRAVSDICQIATEALMLHSYLQEVERFAQSLECSSMEKFIDIHAGKTVEGFTNVGDEY